MALDFVVDTNVRIKSSANSRENYKTFLASLITILKFEILILHDQRLTFIAKNAPIITIRFTLRKHVHAIYKDFSLLKKMTISS